MALFDRLTNRGLSMKTLSNYYIHVALAIIIILLGTKVEAAEQDTYTCYTVDDLRAPVLVTVPDKMRLNAGQHVTVDYGYPEMEHGTIVEINQTTSSMYMYINDKLNGYTIKCTRSYK